MQQNNTHPHRMNAQDVVNHIGKGVRCALETNRLFLGIEKSETENAGIHPEYVATVKVAENLIDARYIVSLEARMRDIRTNAIGLVRLRNLRCRKVRERILAAMGEFKFGKKDSRRLDILVRSEGDSPPILFAEVKLGVRNVAGILKDIERIFRLLDMHHQAELMKCDDIYGAIVFHSMVEGKAKSGNIGHGSKFLCEIRKDLKEKSQHYKWLKCEADFLYSFQLKEPISGYEEFHEDGTVENIFQKAGFAFTPGLVLLGNADDVKTVNF